jgi:hypothetical protein
VDAVGGNGTSDKSAPSLHSEEERQQAQESAAQSPSHPNRQYPRRGVAQSGKASGHDENHAATMLPREDKGTEVEKMLAWLERVFPRLSVKQSAVSLMLQEACQAGSLRLGAADAVTWAQGFTIPEEALAEDAALWARCYQDSPQAWFENMVNHKKQKNWCQTDCQPRGFRAGWTRRTQTSPAYICWP